MPTRPCGTHGGENGGVAAAVARSLSVRAFALGRVAVARGQGFVRSALIHKDQALGGNPSQVASSATPSALRGPARRRRESFFSCEAQGAQRPPEGGHAHADPSLAPDARTVANSRSGSFQVLAQRRPCSGRRSFLAAHRQDVPPDSRRPGRPSQSGSRSPRTVHKFGPCAPESNRLPPRRSPPVHANPSCTLMRTAYHLSILLKIAVRGCLESGFWWQFGG